MALDPGLLAKIPYDPKLAEAVSAAALRFNTQRVARGQLSDAETAREARPLLQALFFALHPTQRVLVYDVILTWDYHYWYGDLFARMPNGHFLSLRIWAAPGAMPDDFTGWDALLEAAADVVGVLRDAERTPTHPMRPSLTPAAYIEQYPWVARHMVPTRLHQGQVDQRMVPCVRGMRLYQLYPGGYASAALWDIARWYEGSESTPPAPFAVRIVDYDDGMCSVYGEEGPMRSLWDLIVGGGELTDQDLTDFGFKGE